MKNKLLFVCSANMMRSPTAEDLFKGSQKYATKSAGILPTATVRVIQDHIDWADRIFVMSEKEDGHLTYLRKNFDILGKNIAVLDIPNIYQMRGHPELRKILQQKLSVLLGETI